MMMTSLLLFYTFHVSFIIIYGYMDTCVELLLFVCVYLTRNRGAYTYIVIVLGREERLFYHTHGGVRLTISKLYEGVKYFF